MLVLQSNQAYRNTRRLRDQEISITIAVLASYISYSTLVEYVFVLRIPDGQRSLRARAYHKLKTHGTRHGRDEGDCAVRVLAAPHFAFPFAEIEDGRSPRLADRDLSRGTR